MVATASVVGSILALVALLRPTLPQTPRATERVVAVALLVYLLVATVTDQFAWVGGAVGVVVGVAWLVPLIAGGLLLPCARCWLAAVACWALLLAATAALMYSASHRLSGMGLFLNGWVS
jgi:hypothetical protein